MGLFSNNNNYKKKTSNGNTVAGNSSDDSVQNNYGPDNTNGNEDKYDFDGNASMDSVSFANNSIGSGCGGENSFDGNTNPSAGGGEHDSSKRCEVEEVKKMALRETQNVKIWRRNVFIMVSSD